MTPGISTVLKIRVTAGDNVVSDWKQKEQADVVERYHLQRFFLVARVLFIFLTMKLKIFLGKLQ